MTLRLYCDWCDGEIAAEAEYIHCRICQSDYHTVRYRCYDDHIHSEYLRPACLDSSEGERLKWGGRLLSQGKPVSAQTS